MSARVGLLIVGPAEHGVVEVAETIADRWPRLDTAPAVLRAAGPADLHTGSGLRMLTGDVTVAHVHVTDQLFGDRCDRSAGAVERLAGELRAAGTALSVTLHDLPHPADEPGRYARRGAAYRRIVQACDGPVLVSSHHEAGLLRAVAPGADPTVVPLPTLRCPPDRAAAPPSDPEVTVVGFVYPGKGHDAALEAVAALPAGIGVSALGRAADGHQDLVADLRRRAAELGRRWSVSGYLPAPELTRRMRAAAVPLVAHRHISASGSIGSWLGAGRRPLVPDGPYTRELAERCPGAVTRYRPDADGLVSALRAALADPASTWLVGTEPLGPGPDEVSQAYAAVLGRPC